MVITKEEQRKYGILVALNGVSASGVKREDIIRQVEQSLITRDKGYMKTLKSGGIAGEKSLHWAIQRLLNERMISKPNPKRPDYVITNRGKGELERIARKVHEHWNTQPGKLLLTDKTCQLSSSYIDDTTREDAARLRNMLYAAGIPF